MRARPTTLTILVTVSLLSCHAAVGQDWLSNFDALPPDDHPANAPRAAERLQRIIHRDNPP